MIGYCTVCKKTMNAAFCDNCHAPTLLDEEFEPHTFASEEEEKEWNKRRVKALERRGEMISKESIRATLEDIVRTSQVNERAAKITRIMRADAAKYRSGRKS